VCATVLVSHLTETWPEAMEVQSRKIHLTSSDLGNTIWYQLWNYNVAPALTQKNYVPAMWKRGLNVMHSYLDVLFHIDIVFQENSNILGSGIHFVNEFSNSRDMGIPA
jgi:hypothetical protein